MNRRPPLLPLAAATLVLALAAGCTGEAPAVPLPPVTAASDTAAGRAAADWLVEAAAGTTVYRSATPTGPQDDPVLSADVALALTATGRRTEARRTVEALSTPDAVTAAVGDGRTRQDVAATAVLVAAVVATDGDPADVGGRDLVAELSALASPDGRYRDLGPQDSSRTSTQAWAVAALAAAGAPSRDGVTYLVDQQCPAGGFPAELSSTDPTSTAPASTATTTTDAGVASDLTGTTQQTFPGCVPDVDATSLAVSALVRSGVSPTASVVTGAITWLTATADSDADGTFWVSAGTTEPNAASTALAAAAFLDARVDDSSLTTWLEAQAVTSGADAGALTRDGQPDVRTTAWAARSLVGAGFVTLLR